MGKVWPDVFIEESNLARHVLQFAAGSGKGADGRKYIETIPKRGYRFVGLLHEHEDRQSTSPTGVTAEGRRRTSGSIPGRPWENNMGVVTRSGVCRGSNSRRLALSGDAEMLLLNRSCWPCFHL